MFQPGGLVDRSGWLRGSKQALPSLEHAAGSRVVGWRHDPSVPSWMRRVLRDGVGESQILPGVHEMATQSLNAAIEAGKEADGSEDDLKDVKKT